MIVKFDSLSQFEIPSMTLCNPGSVYNNGLITNAIGGISGTEAEENVFNFNSSSELNFRINQIAPDGAEYTGNSSIYKAILNRRLIFLEDIGYFIITNVKNGIDENGCYKDVSARSVDAELEQKMVPYIEDGTYRFLSDGTQNGILNKIVSTVPMWEIGHVDSSVAEKFRTFEDVDTGLNCLSFLLKNVQDAYECIVLFDIVNRLINVYDRNTYADNTDIYISREDIVDKIEISENSDDLYTAMTALGDKDLTISAVNPLGTNTIYNFSYYLSWMTANLRERMTLWARKYDGYKDTYRNKNLLYYKTLDTKTNKQMDLDNINIRISIYEKCRNNIIAESNTSSVPTYNKEIEKLGGTPVNISQEVNAVIAQIDGFLQKEKSAAEAAEREIKSLTDQMNTIDTELAAIRNELSFENWLTDAQYSELMNYIFEGSYQDEYVTTTDSMTYEEKFSQMTTLYDRAMETLRSASTPTLAFNIDMENFIFVKDFQRWTNQLQTGCIINAELDVDDVAQLFLSSMTVNYDDCTLSMKFGNKYKKFDPKSLFDNVLGNIKRSANSIGYIKDLIDPLKQGELDSIRMEIQNSRDLTMAGAIASQNEEVVIDGSGYTGKKVLPDGTYDPKQIKITGKNIVFTDDAWESAKVAIGDLQLGDGKSGYGINAENIIGDMIIGSELHILDKDGNNILDVQDDKIHAAISNMKIGGENLLKNSKSLIGYTIAPALSSSLNDGLHELVDGVINIENRDGLNSNDMITTPTAEFRSGLEYTFSCIVKDNYSTGSDNNHYGIALTFFTSSGGFITSRNISGGITKKDNGDGWTLLTAPFVFNIPDAMSVSINFYTGMLGSAVVSAFSFKRPMLVIGNTPTSWAPAPVDNESLVLEKTAELNIKADSISQHVSEVDAEALRRDTAMELRTDGIVSEVRATQHGVDEIKKTQTEIIQKADGLTVQIQEIRDNGVTKVDTGRGFALTPDRGFTVSKPGEAINSALDFDGLKVNRNDTPVLVANPSGVDALNINVRKFLTLGHLRIEELNGEVCGFWRN